MVLRKGRIHKTATYHNFKDDNYVSNLVMHMFLYFKTHPFMLYRVDQNDYEFFVLCISWFGKATLVFNFFLEMHRHVFYKTHVKMFFQLITCNVVLDRSKYGLIRYCHFPLRYMEQDRSQYRSWKSQNEG